MSTVRTFALMRDNTRVGTLEYDTEQKEFHVHVSRDVPMSILPGYLLIPAEAGVYDLTPEQSMSFVRHRICPPGRHNIKEILWNIGLKEYDEFGILLYNEARSVVDDMYMVEI